MKSWHCWMTVLIVMTALQACAWAQAEAKTPEMVEKGVATARQIMPQLKFDSVPLDQALDYIRDTVPGFNSVVVREPGVDAKYPVLPAMTLKNVTVEQFLDLIKVSYPMINIDRLDGPAGPLYSIHIQATAQSAPPAAGMPHGMPGVGGMPDGMASSQTVVRVYPLEDIVNGLANKKFIGEGDPKTFTKNALNDVLSLVQAALEQTEGDDKPLLKVHEATLTLLFKGSPAKRNVVESALNTLQPKEDTAAVARLKAQIDEMTLKERANTEIHKITTDSLRRELEQARLVADTARKNELEIQSLKAQLNQLKNAPTTQPKE